MPNRSEWGYMRGPSYGVDLSLGWTTDSSTLWHLLRHQPVYGVRVNYARFHPSLAGDRYGVAAFMKTPILAEDPSNRLFFELDFGLSLFTEPYVRTHDSRNQFIGSYLNCLIHAGFSYLHSLPGGDAVSIDVKLVHSSNGYLQKPNQGWNVLEGGLGYHLGVEKQSAFGWLGQDTVCNDYLLVSYAPGMVKPRWSSGGNAPQPYYYCHTAEVAMMWRPSLKYAWGLGVDVNYNYSQRPLSTFHHDSYTLPFYIGGVVSIEPYWGRLSVRASLGAYLLKSRLSSVVSLPFYERIGLFYHISHHLFTGISMRAYAAHVDYIEWNIGWNIGV